MPVFIARGLVMRFAILFGLSMDYEIFLIPRICEEYAKRRDTGRVVVFRMLA
jgi:uncharacterized membrane protein YdfJ with MMPL/SSD domain